MRISSPLLRPRILASGLFLATLTASPAAIWTSTATGNWSDTANWQGNTIASGTDAIADFSTLDITANTTVHLDGNQTVGSLIFGDTATATGANWTLDSNPTGKLLTLATTAGTPTITVNALGSSKLVTISANIAGTQGLTKAGAGTLVLTGSNSYSGGTKVTAGTLQIGSSGTNPTLGMGDVQVSSGATVTFALGGTYNISNNISGAGALIKAGSGGTMVAAGAITITGTTSIQTGILRMGGANVLSSNSIVSFGASGAPTASLDLGNGSASYDQTIGGLTSVGTLANSANYSITNSDSTAGHVATLTINQNADATFNGIIKDGASGAAVAITKAGSKTLTLGASNTYSGATTVSSGTLKANAANVLSANSAVSLSAGATLDISGGNNTIGSLAGAGGSVALGSSTLTAGNDGKSTTFAGSISGAGSLTKAGTGEQTLSGISGFTGTTLVQGGKLSVSGSITATTGVTVSQGAELAVTGLVNQSTTINMDGTLSGTGLVGAVSVGSTGSVNAGSNGIGTLTTKDFTLASTSLLNFDLTAGNTTAGAGVNDLIVVNGALTLDGVLNITALGTLTSGTYTLFTYTGNLIDNGLDLSSAFETTYAGSRITASNGMVDLVVVAVPEPGTWAMIAGGLGTLLAFHRARRRS